MSFIILKTPHEPTEYYSDMEAMRLSIVNKYKMMDMKVTSVIKDNCVKICGKLEDEDGCWVENYFGEITEFNDLK